MFRLHFPIPPNKTGRRHPQRGLISTPFCLGLFLCMFAALATLQIQPVFAQNYTDTLYSISTETNIIYGESINFAGTNTTLQLDVSRPTDAPLPECGRPLVLIVHGGAWVAGSKNDAGIVNLRETFAKRGFAAAAINYRLGFFLSAQNLNCNVPNWNCSLAADSSEWIRAWYRGVQDAKGALRYLVANRENYQIDTSQIFLLGESAGGFIALGAAYLDNPLEKPADCQLLPPVQAPNAAYFAPCIQNSSWAQEIATMNLNRPDLGSIEGELNLKAGPYRVKAVANMFGGMLRNLFALSDGEVPDLYTFHQPNDLIVPIGRSRLLQGFSDCAASTGCVGIPNRPWSWGSQAMLSYLDTAQIPPSAKPTVQAEITGNNANCLTQILNPSQGGHQYDAPFLRSTQAAAFFAARITANDCLVGQEQPATKNPISVLGQNRELVIQSSVTGAVHYRIVESSGRIVQQGLLPDGSGRVSLHSGSQLFWVWLLDAQGKTSCTPVWLPQP